MDLLLNSRLILLIILIVLSTLATAGQQKWKHRKLTTTIYGSDLAYVKAEGLSDTLHNLFSGQTEMSILSIKTTSKGSLEINTTVSPPHIEVIPAESFLYAFGIVFNQLIEYNDSKDSAKITDYDPKTWKIHNTSMKITSNKDNTIIFEKNITINNVTGKVSFTFQNFVDDSRQDILPHLIVISNSSLLDFVIKGVKPSFNNSRFALATSYISHGKSDFSIRSEKSLDDEYTPGTFEVSNWVAASDYHSFLQWKPVSYFDSHRSTQTSTYTRIYTSIPESNSTLSSNSSLAYSFFATSSDYNMTNNIISFGRSDDKFYVRNKFTAWSATLGHGVPPAEKVSIMAIAIISVGLGIPVLLFMGGGIYLCVKRRRSGYQQVFGTISS